MNLWLSIALILLLFIIGGIFAAAEMALVTLRESQITALAGKGKRGKAIVELTSNPNRFLSSVQIGVTLAGFLSSAFGSDSLARDYVAPLFASWGMPHGLASVLAVILVTALISFGSIVISELTSKRLAMQRPEVFSLALAPMINAIAKLCRPIVWALGKCTNGLVNMLGGDPQAGKEQVSGEELRAMVANSDLFGVEERRIVDDVFDAGDRSLREVMVPRTEVDFLPGDMPAYKAVREVQGSPHSRYPVTDGSPDQIVGFLHVRDLFDLDPATRSTAIRQLVRPVLSLPETVKVLRALSDMRRARSHLAIVLDEYGGTAGIVTLEDLVEELVGDITDEYDVIDDRTRAHKAHRDVDGLWTLEEFQDRTGYLLPEGPYDTVAGYVVAQLGEVPKVGDAITVTLYPHDFIGDKQGSRSVELVVTEMDGRRIAWLRAHWLGAATHEASDATARHTDTNQASTALAATSHDEVTSYSRDAIVPGQPEGRPTPRDADARP